jgi:uncharacterized membrane protein
VSGVHALLGVGVLATNLLAGVWGAVAWLRDNPSRVFWYLLRAAQIVVVAQVLLGLTLIATGHGAPQGLHIVYGVSPLVIALVTEAMRVGASQRELEEIDDVHALEHDEQVGLARRMVKREMGVMTIGVLMIVTLALRAYVTGS